MTRYFVSRHPGAMAWARQQGVAADFQVTHIDPEIIHEGDLVIGTLPVNLAARVCQRGGRYLHLSLLLPHAWRGRELSVDELHACDARLEEYRIEHLPGLEEGA
ncbi:MAG: CRISPR-associated protein Csx16 [Magnetococcales bacterium]|nr:CRISPR-associated protein Csx16 [Magnetococcales bacterium]